jgi:hypothetical protein
VTGRFPHPIRDPAGHSFGETQPAPAPIDPSHWTESGQYLYAIDLFNYGYYWEAHEAWEGLWHAVGRKGIVGDFLKGLIKLAAAGVKAREGRPEGVRRHAERARQLFRLMNVEKFCGIAIGELINQANGLIADPPRPSASNAPVEVVFTFALNATSH